MTRHVTHLSEIPEERIPAPDGSCFGGRRRRVGAALGARKLGYSFFIVPPGKAAFPYHAHAGNEEMIYVLEGDAVLRLGSDEISVTAGTVIACPPGLDRPHQLINSGSSELKYLVVSTMEYPDLSEYPDSKKIGAYASPSVGPRVSFRALYLKDRSIQYYEGENGDQVQRILERVRKR